MLLRKEDFETKKKNNNDTFGRTVKKLELFEDGIDLFHLQKRVLMNKNFREINFEDLFETGFEKRFGQICIT